MQRPDSSLSIVPLRAFKDNYIWLLVRGDEAAVVDPGDAGPVEEAIAARGLRLGAILLTHHHADHVGGVPALLAARRADPPAVFGPAGEAIADVGTRLVEGDRVMLDRLGIAFTVIDVPGHTRGHIAYFAAADPEAGRAEPVLFCGDTLFAAGCGRLFEGTAAQMHASLSKLAALPAETLVYCAHEYTLSNLRFARAADPADRETAARERAATALREAGQPTIPSTIGLERATNPFLRDAPALRSAAARRAPGADASALATFTALRQWKDAF